MRCVLVIALIAFNVMPSLRGAGSHAPAVVEPTRLSIPMRDGVKLTANLFRPEQAGRQPTILVRTPYNKDGKFGLAYQWFIDFGYNVVVQDVRGRGESQGVFSPLSQEPDDGDDTIDWIAAQPWSDGKVGMTGGSYLGFTQWKVAVRNNPHLRAILPIVSGDDDYRDRIYSPGGAMKWGHRLEWVAENMRAPGYVPPPFQQFIWSLPLRHADTLVTGSSSNMLQEAFDHPSYDAFWKAISTREKLKTCRVPVFAIGGWYDNYVEGDLDAFATLRKHSAVNRLLIGPWTHAVLAPIPTVDAGSNATIPIRHMQIGWFDEFLKGREVPAASVPPLRIYVMGANQWRDENEWPLARALPVKFYLAGNGHANSGSGDGVLSERATQKAAADHYVYDPKKPVPTTGGSVCCNDKVFPWGPMDQRPTEKRGDVLVYTTVPLKEDIEVTGPISLILFAATSALDTDFTAKLVDVYPDGRAINLTDGILRARYRDGLDKPHLLKPNEPVRYTVDAGVTSNVFRKGHAIRLEISSSNFPRFDRNPNTGRPIADETQLLKASQTVFHDRGRRSYLLLPVVPPKPTAIQTHLNLPKI